MQAYRQPVSMLQINVSSPIPLDELVEITDNFDVKCVIGEGSYGNVYYGVLESGRAAAIKKLDSSNQEDQVFLEQVWP